MTTPWCGGCAGLGAHNRACRDPLGHLANLVEELGDTFGSNDMASSNRAYRIAEAIRRHRDEDKNMAAPEVRSDVVAEVIDERVKVYGDPTKTFPQIAEVWSGILGHKVQPAEVPLMLIGMKLVRTAQAPDYSDNSDDIEGYLDIFRKVVGEDMVHARSVTEFVELKRARR